MLYTGIIFITLILAVGIGFLWKKNASKHSFDAFLSLLKSNQKEPILSYLKLLSASDKKKLWRTSSQHAEEVAMSIQSEEVLEALIVEGFDINLSHKYTPQVKGVKNQKSKMAKSTPETLFTWALYSSTLNPPGEFSLAGALLTHYKFDLFQLKKFEAQVKNSQLKMDIPLALRLRSEKDNVLGDNRVGHLLQFSQKAKV